MDVPNCQRPSRARTVSIRALESTRQEHREGLEPSFPHYGCGVVAAGPPVHRRTQAITLSVRPEGLEPSLARVRAGCAAANTLVPIFVFSLAISGVEGTRTLTFPLKRRKRCRYATTLKTFGRRVDVSAATPGTCSFARSSFASSPEWSRTTADGISDRHASVTPPDNKSFLVTDSREGES